ncbi:O-methyltransferase-domain-containing protein, partial [Leptodontidium sp. MPI-SDFR-AT-0119]
MSSPNFRALAAHISQLVEAHDPSSANAPQTLLQLRRAARELEQQCVPPSELEFEFHHRPHQNACVRIAIELKIFDHLDDDELIRPSELAARIDLANPEFTLRIVRVLCASGVLGEQQLPSEEIVVHHTALSKLWRSRPASQAYAQHQWDNMVLALSNLVPFLRTRGFQSPDDPSNSPFAYALGAENVDFFHLLQRYPERLASFNQGMTGTATSVVKIFPFAKLAEVHDSLVCLVDVGGGRGHTTQEILTACPELKGTTVVLEDLPAVLEHREDLQVDHTLVQVQPYNFLLDEQPVRGAAAYLYKSIFHDWPDASCHQILRNLAPAMRGFDSRLLICDLVVGQMASTQPYKALRDMNMMIMAGRERTVTDWEALLGKEGFRIVHIWGVENCGNSVIEARL